MANSMSYLLENVCLVNIPIVNTSIILSNLCTSLTSLYTVYLRQLTPPPALSVNLLKFHNEVYNAYFRHNTNSSYNCRSLDFLDPVSLLIADIGILVWP